MKYDDNFNPVDDLFDKKNSSSNDFLNISGTQNTDSVAQKNTESCQNINENIINDNYNQSAIQNSLNNNQNYDYSDTTNIEYNQNNNKKRGFNKSIIYAIVGFLLFIAVGIVITNLVIKIIEQKKANEEEIAVLTDSVNIKAVGFDFDKPFDKNKFEYNLEIDTKKVQIKCNKLDNVTGCNEIVNLGNKTSLDHVIEYTSQKGKKYKYTIHITKKTETGPIKIDSIEFEKTDYSNKSTTVVVKANSDKNKKLKYSFDGGNTWQDDNKYTTDENEDVNVVIKDDDGNTTDPKEIEIDNIDTVAPTVNIEEKEKQESKIILFANAKDDLSGIDKYNWNESGYTNNSTYEATKAGTYTVKVKDKAGNESVKASITIPESYFKKEIKKETYIYKVTFNGNGASVSKSELSCSTTGLSCKIKLPEIKRDNGIIIGYSENANATTPQYTVGQEISVTENKILYAITAKKIILTINGNGATVKDNEKKCYIYNKNTSCKITTPTITRSGYSIIGFNSNANATTAEYKVSSNLNIDKDKTIYAITSKKLTAAFDGNGATVSKTSLSCNLYNNNKTCTITTPTITRNGYSIIGFNSNANATSPEYKVNSSASIDKNKTIYAITSKKLTATFKGNGASVSSSSSSCNIYNTAKTCNVTVPTITRSGWTILGFSTSASATTGSTSKTLPAGKTYYAITSKKLTLTVNGNGATVSKSSVTCNVYNNGKTCKVTTPTITRSGYSIIGFNSNANATSSEYKTNTSVTLDKDKTIYAITNKKLTLTVNGNGATVSKSSVICNVYNNGKTCNVTTPTITRSGYSIIGFNSNANATSSEYKTSASVTLDKNKTIYAITSKKLTATFKGNGASVSSSSLSCNIYNTVKTCNVTVPTITRSGWTILGFSTSASATTGSTAKTLSAGKTYYAITKKNITVTFAKNDQSSYQYKDFDYIEYPSKSKSCTVYNTGSCKIKIPFVDVKGLSTSGFVSKKSNPDTYVSYIIGQSYDFNQNTTLYVSFYNSDGFKNSIFNNVGTRLEYKNNQGKIIIDFEKGCNATNYKKFFDTLSSKAPYLFSGNMKITIYKPNTFNKGFSKYKEYDGLNYGYSSHRLLAIKYYETGAYSLIIHELAHRWNSIYSSKNNKSIEESFSNLYTKYKSKPESERPMRKYSYNNLSEFFADTVMTYYFLYIDKNTGVNTAGWYLPNDIKSKLEQYIP